MNFPKIFTRIMFGLGNAAVLTMLARAEPLDGGWSLWTERFVAFASSSTPLSADRSKVQGELSTLMPLKADSTRGCERSFSLARGAPSFIVSAQAIIISPLGADCRTGHLGLLLVGLSGATPKVVKVLESQLSAALHRSPQLIVTGNNTDLHWQLTPQAAVEVGTSSAEPGQMQIRVANASQAFQK